MQDQDPATHSSEPTDTPVVTTTDPAQAGSSTASKTGSAIREIVETLLLAALIFFAVRLVVLNFRVDGESMTPNLDNEEMLLVNRNAYRTFDLNWLTGLLPGADAKGSGEFAPFSAPERGDIIVFNPPTSSDKPYIKRIIGLPGEEVTFNGGHVYIDGHLLDEPYIDERTNCGNGPNCDVVVPDGDIFVLGDNRTNSSDSRVFGPVGVDRVIGKAWFAYWPVDDIGPVPHHDYGDISQGAPPPVTATAQPDDEAGISKRERRARDRAERQNAPATAPAQ